VEGGAAASALARVGDRLSGGVVVVAEFFVAQAGAAAAVAVGEDVAALKAFWCFGSGSVLHVSPHWVKSVQSIQMKRPESVLRVRSFALECEKPGWLAGLFSIYFYCSEWSETKMPRLAGIFFPRKLFILFWLLSLAWDLRA
jgi:hypothetical protein